MGWGVCSDHKSKRSWFSSFREREASSQALLCCTNALFALRVEQLAAFWEIKELLCFHESTGSWLCAGVRQEHGRSLQVLLSSWFAVLWLQSPCRSLWKPLGEGEKPELLAWLSVGSLEAAGTFLGVALCHRGVTGWDLAPLSSAPAVPKGSGSSILGG